MDMDLYRYVSYEENVVAFSSIIVLYGVQDFFEVLTQDFSHQSNGKGNDVSIKW